MNFGPREDGDFGYQEGKREARRETSERIAELLEPTEFDLDTKDGRVRYLERVRDVACGLHREYRGRGRSEQVDVFENDDMPGLIEIRVKPRAWPNGAPRGLLMSLNRESQEWGAEINLKEGDQRRATGQELVDVLVELAWD